MIGSKAIPVGLVRTGLDPPYDSQQVHRGYGPSIIEMIKRMSDVHSSVAVHSSTYV